MTFRYGRNEGFPHIGCNGTLLSGLLHLPFWLMAKDTNDIVIYQHHHSTLTPAAHTAAYQWLSARQVNVAWGEHMYFWNATPLALVPQLSGIGCTVIFGRSVVLLLCIDTQKTARGIAHQNQNMTNQERRKSQVSNVNVRLAASPGIQGQESLWLEHAQNANVPFNGNIPIVFIWPNIWVRKGVTQFLFRFLHTLLWANTCLDEYSIGSWISYYVIEISMSVLNMWLLYFCVKRI